MSPEPVVLVSGGTGQLGREMSRAAPAGWRAAAPGSAAMDVTDLESVRRYVLACRPAVIVNAAAFTAVDRAETEATRARAVNGTGAGNLAVVAAETGARFIQISTDFVFDGSQSRPYRPHDPTGPVNEYGRSKLAGEAAVREALGERALILRTAWLYGVGEANFVGTMVRLLRRDGTVRVVADQIGTPTWARGLAGAVWRAARLPDFVGIHHWTDAGVASWYDFAVAVAEEASAARMLPTSVAVEPIRTEDYPTPARRPAFSVLDKSSAWAALGTPAHWRTNLRIMLKGMGNG